MPLSARKAAASHFVDQIHRSNALHHEYLDDAQLLDSYDRFTNWQLDYLLPLYTDLYDRQGYREAIEFVISDLSGIGISSRDRDLERAAPALSRLLPLKALETIATAAETNARILEINIAICRCLLIDDRLPAEITELDYFVACREASSLEDCVGLVHLITGLGETLSALVRIPLIGITLRAMRMPAHAAGFGALQEFLESGYTKFREIADVDEFLHELEHRAISIFERIYTARLDQLQ